MSGGGLNQKRILVTDTDSDFGKDIANALVVEGALVFTLVKECRGMQQVLEQHPQLTPVLLDIGKEQCEDQARKFIQSFPSIDHFVNLSGGGPLNIISQAYPNSKIHDVSDTKVKPVISKMIDAGPRCLIFTVSFGQNQNIMSKLKANLDPRFTNSKTAQISTNVRQSFKRMFSSGNGETDKTRTEQVEVRESNVAASFAAMATSLNHNNSQDVPNGNSSASTSTTSPKKGATTSPRIQTLQEKNYKIKHSVLKLQKTCAKKWKKAEKKISKEQQSTLKSLHRDIERTKKNEKAGIMKQLSDANAATMSRSNALSEDTANRILEARENRADKEVEKHAQKKLEKETSRILETKDKQLTESHEKLYKKMVDKQITEFNRLRVKYLV